MAWTPAQLAKAKKLFKARGNKKSWSECVGLACKGTARKPAKKAVKKDISGTRGKKAPAKKKAAKRVTIVKASARKVNVKVGSLGSMSLSKVREAQQDIARLEKMKANAGTVAERKQIAGAISGLKKLKNSFKKFL